ncbi:hypothetical protein M2475_001962 [Breznakia sp. PF5-3]|uniref:DUF4194 domain-containing protein n=1 Tax=unclassified Breznakia TaxID=2623764 RepID=UPI00240730A5|nr:MULTISPECIES: DUF4194 domain-containing protein [unclassified Breznakia]MDL2276822.1 DUF4194 domain-containing protein [Breznakia sp. OttesenSCG-928-G09]MDF9825515.1 hypothetical protein [Breznakia sp. PM6-1]MDF9836382.1 hypothetical protein [Breznakia sp. PF5-3]MDF9838726.1 hypothetical protein [Breznakia sp. PFB2-8]MDF9860534.1 hypothetical protein [Breznakia sp. PH5-24]
MEDKMEHILRTYSNMSTYQRDNFSRILNRLLSVNYLCGGRKKDRNDYYFISDYESLFSNFLILIDYNFYINKADQVVYIINKNNYNHLNINKIYSVVLLLLRKMYFQKSQELQDTEFINVTLGELHAEVEATGLYDKRINITELKELYQFLSRYNICERIGDLRDDDSRLILYPTINYILPIHKINEIEERIQNYKQGVNNEDIDKSEID